MIKKLQKRSLSLPPGLLPSSGVLILYMLIAAVSSVLFTQDNNWDLRNYHFYNAFAYFNDRSGLDILAAQLQSFFNPILDNFLYVLIVNFRPITVGAILGMIHGLNYFLVFKITEASFSRIESHSLAFRSFSLQITSFKLALLVSFAAFVAPASFNLLGTSYHDNFVSIPLLLSIFFIIKALDAQENRLLLLLFLGGIAAGISFGIKMTSLIIILASTVAMFIVLPKLWPKLQGVAIYGGGIITGALFSGGFWYWRMWETYGNPIFPFFNNIFKAPDVFNVAIRDARYLPTSFIDGLLYPFYFMYNSAYTYGQGSFSDLRFAILFVIIIVWGLKIIFDRTKGVKQPTLSKEFTFLLIFFSTAYVIWLVQFSIYRYLFMLEALAFLPITILVYQLFPSKKIGTTFIVGFIILTALYGSFPRHHRIPWQENYINASFPALEGLDSSVVILGGKRPTACFAPLFPPTTKFMRLSSNMHHYISANSRFSQQIFDLLASHQGNFYLLSWGNFIPQEQRMFQALDFEIDTRRSWRFNNPHEPRLQIWKVNRK